MGALENEFYIALLSNGSSKNYPDNTQSAFTNDLSRYIKIDEGWSVGLTEIFLNPFVLDNVSEQLSQYVDNKNTEVFHCCNCVNKVVMENKPTQKHEYSPEREGDSDSYSIDESVEVFNPEIKPVLKRLRQENEKKKFTISFQSVSNDFPYYIMMS